MHFYKEVSKKLLFVSGSLMMLVLRDITFLVKGILNASIDVSEIFSLIPIILVCISVYLIYRGHNWIKWILGPMLILIGGIILIVKFPPHVIKIEILIGIYLIVIGVLIILEKSK